MLAIGTRAAASCCASTSPFAAFMTYHARASFSCGGDACAAPATTSAAALLDTKLLAHLQRIRAHPRVERLQLLDRDPHPCGDRAERVARLHGIEPPLRGAVLL